MSDNDNAYCNKNIVNFDVLKQSKISFKVLEIYIPNAQKQAFYRRRRRRLLCK